MSDTQPLTRRQIRRLDKLPEDHEIVSNGDSPSIVRGPKGQLLRVGRNGGLEGLVERVRSYLHISG